jgi:hypothetical protein
MPTSRTVGLEVRGGAEVVADLRAVAAEVDAGLRELERAGGRDLVRAIQRNANTGIHEEGEPHTPGTGPGPNVVTGDYVLSWQVEYGPEGATVYTDAPQADRLEYGFHAVDSLGRRFDQPAYPHIQPAVDEVEAGMESKADALIDLVVRGVRL